MQVSIIAFFLSSLSDVHCLCLSVYSTSSGTKGMEVLSQARGENGEEFGNHFASTCSRTGVLSIYKWSNYCPLFRARAHRNR